MKKYFFTLFGVILFSASTFAQPTWADDISCIIYNHCSSCHNSEGIAPFTLMNYDDAFNNRFSIEYSASQKTMPPWPPNQDYNAMAHATSLTDEQIQLISDWVAAGAPEGDPNNAPEPPTFSGEGEITDPDYVATLDEYTVPSINSDLYRCFVVPTNLGEDKMITEIEIIPGNRNIVHHVLVYQDVSNSVVNQDNNEPGPGYTCFGSPGSNSAELIAGWVPGSRPRKLPDGMGIPLPNGANLVAQIHYPEGSTGQTDQTKIRFKFADGTSGLRTVYNQPILNFFSTMVNGPLYIPANEVRTFYQEYEIPVPVTGISIAPHAHLLCTSMRAWAELPDGSTIDLIDIPNWDFEWQGFYDLQTPVVLPPGTLLKGEATYDNTSSNPNNPNSPPQNVSAGEATGDEMMVFYMTFLVYNFGDENLEVEDRTAYKDYLLCKDGLTDVDDPISLDSKIEFYPNPVKEGVLNINAPSYANENLRLRLVDITGREVFNADCQGACSLELPTSLPEGTYFAELFDNQGNRITRTEKITVLK